MSVFAIITGQRHPFPIDLEEGFQLDLAGMRLLLTSDWRPERIEAVIRGPLEIAFRRLGPTGPPIIHCGIRFLQDSPPLAWEQSWHYNPDKYKLPEPLPEDQPELGYTFMIYGVEYRTQRVVMSRLVVLTRRVSDYLRAFAQECQGRPVSLREQFQEFVAYMDRFPAERIFRNHDVSMSVDRS
jgi:hypothetical protein